MKFNIVDQLKSKYLKVSLLCKTLGVSRSGYYSSKTRLPGDRSKANKELIEKIKLIHNTSKQTYGVPRVKAKLTKDGELCGKNRVARLMKKEGLKGVASKKYVVKTTDSNHKLPIAPRVFKTEDKSTFPAGPNKVWASDITYIPTKEGWLFLAIYLDLFTRKIVGYSMADNMRTELVLKALNMALLNQKPRGSDLVSHTDRGSQYASYQLNDRLNLLGITASMSRTGNCYDNAYAETFFHTLKVELVHREEFKTRQEAKSKIFNYIETWYNKERLHSSLGFMSPVEYEEKHKLTA